MSGRCSCGNALIPTVTEGGIRKYLQLAKSLADGCSDYIRQRLELIERYLAEAFPQKQTSLADFLLDLPQERKKATLADFLEGGERNGAG